MEWLLYLSLAAGSLAVIWLTILSLLAIHQGGTIRQLQADGVARDQVLREIRDGLQRLVTENDMRRIIREELPVRRQPRAASAVNITAQHVGAVAGHDVGPVTANPKGE